MAHKVSEEVVVNAPLQTVWAYVKPFDTFSVRLWDSKAEITNGKGVEEVGVIRDITAPDGEHIIERLTYLSNEEYKLRYEIVNKGVHGLQNYDAEITLRPATPQPVHATDLARGDPAAKEQATVEERHAEKTHISFSSQFDADHPSASKETLSALYQRGLKALQSHFDQ
eukprot:TRINITY_DN13307_c0_g1_i1.p1 TRINITY_DN13307_c0_g1~~TRINITY_DN13307_c0_g1_i1.p1  ORF type:complete len:169 (+),score=41.90 TRINITY_DN13307_c0_g1_i1:16-522(+)